MVLFDKVKSACSLERNSFRPGDDGEMGKVAIFEFKVWCVGNQKALSGQFCASIC